MTEKLELKSCHEVIDTVDVANIESIFYGGKPTDPDILTVVMKGGKRLYCDEVCPIDSLQEEPYGPNLAEKATKTPEKAFKQMESNSGPKDKCKGCNNVKGCITCVDGSEWAHYEEPVLSNVGRTVKNWKEEPVSEDLEKESKKYSSCIYLEEVLSDDDKEVLKGRLINTFKAGANWQKEQDKETIELAEDHAMFAGIIRGTEHTIGEVRSLLNKVAYKNNGLDVNGDYCEQLYVELDNEFRKLLKEG